jgi:hypothetical protein
VFKATVRSEVAGPPAALTRPVTQAWTGRQRFRQLNDKSSLLHNLFIATNMERATDACKPWRSSLRCSGSRGCNKSALSLLRAITLGEHPDPLLTLENKTKAVIISVCKGSVLYNFRETFCFEGASKTLAPPLLRDKVILCKLAIGVRANPIPMCFFPFHFSWLSFHRHKRLS